MKLYISITTSISLALSICVLFISLMQSVNGAQFLNISSFSLLPRPAADAVPLEGCIHHYNHTNLTLTSKFSISFDYLCYVFQAIHDLFQPNLLS